MRTTSSSVRCSSSCSSSTSEFDRNHNHQKKKMKTRKNVMRFSQARSQRNRSSIGSEHAMIDRDELERGQSAQKNPSQWLQRARESKESERVGVLLLNLGGPETLDDVEPFLYNLFRDPDIIRLPRQFKFLQTIVASVISKSRAPKSRKAYASIGGGSPLRRITNEQKNALKAAIRRKGFESCECYVGMRYWKPFTEDAIEEIKRDRITRLVVLPLYPQFSISTSGSSLRLLEEIFREDDVLKRLNMQHTVIPSWYSRPGYVRSMAKMIKKTLESEAFVDAPEKPVVFFSAHGVPTSYVLEGGDPYKDEMEECVKLITDELKMIGCEGYKHVLAYQSRVGPVEWLKPYTDDTIRALGDQGTKALCAVPVSFVSEHIETLEEMDQEYRELAEESGIEYWGRVPALDCDEIFIDDLADAVVEALPSSTTTTSQSQSSKNTTTSTTKEIVPSKTSVDEILSAYDSKDLTIPTREFTYETDDVLPFIAVSAFCLFLGIQVRLGIEGIFAPGAGIVPDGLGGSDFFPFQ